MFSVDLAQGAHEVVEPAQPGDPIPAAEHRGAEVQHVRDATRLLSRQGDEHLTAEL